MVSLKHLKLSRKENYVEKTEWKMTFRGKPSQRWFDTVVKRNLTKNIGRIQHQRLEFSEKKDIVETEK